MNKAVLALTFGLLLGMSRSSLTHHYLKLTKFDGGVYVRATKKVDFPCMYRCNNFGEMHSRDEKIIIYVEQDYKFFSLLKGIPPAPGPGGNSV